MGPLGNMEKDMGYLVDTFPTYKAGRNGEGKPFYKNNDFAPVYEEVLTRFQGKDVVLVEIGTGHGGCLQVWKDYLGPKAMIYGIDHKGELFFEEERIKHFLADQKDRTELSNVPISEIDIFIDDASHVNEYQINTFEIFFPRMRSGGLYIVEDVGTSYRVANYGGGYRKHGTFVEYCKDIVDVIYMNEWRDLIPAEPQTRAMVEHIIPMNPLFGSVETIAFYNGMVVIRKK